MEEFTSSSPEDKSEDNAENKSKKKKKLGAFAVERPQLKPEEKPKKSDEEKSAQKKPPEVEPATEAEAPLEKLAPEEEQTVRRNFIEQRLERPPLQEAGQEDEVDLAAAEAVGAFQARVLDGTEPKAALEETIVEIGPAETHESETIETKKEPNMPQELGEEVIHLNSQPHEKASEPPASPKAVKSKPKRPANPLIPAVEQAWPRQTGLYNKNIAAAGGKPGAIFNPEYVPVRDELLLRHLPGGIVGYIMGRRHGRVKTEKRLLTTQRKLESQVQKLEQDLIDKEIIIRRKVYEHADIKASDAQARAEAMTPPRPTGSEIAAGLVGEAQHGNQAPEALGHIAVDAGNRPVETKIKSESPEKARKLPTVQKIETMHRSELLQLSEEINIDGTNLRRIYETHLVGEQGLRRLLKEHLEGGDIKKALRQEIVEREIDFERDPILRDRAKTANGTGPAALQKLLKEAKVSAAESSEEAAFYKARAAFESEQQALKQQRRRLMDAGFVITILVLLALVILFYLNRQ